ncbi:MAG TPA: MerR family transcriptional regulator [Ktedonobacteraceae bacterium]|jgi:DNA-binding transcriptional MerR regulator
MTIQEVAEKTGISAYTIRFYEKSGILPRIQRTEGGIRQFTEADVTFLLFLMELKRTGMSLEEIAEFTEDGCLLERLQQGDIPQQPMERRITILRKHEQRLYEQRRQIDYLLGAVAQKIQFYERCLEDRQSNNPEILQND